MISSTLLTLIVIPAIFGLVKGFWLPSELSPELTSVRKPPKRPRQSLASTDQIKPVDFCVAVTCPELDENRT
jgi:Cu(I)/Ag(I) efflux system membrane protein CusA/SilA